MPLAEAFFCRLAAGFVCSSGVQCEITTRISAILAKFPAELLEFEHADEPPGDLLNEDSDSVGQGWGLRTCISNKLSGEAQKGARELRPSTLLTLSSALCSSEQRLHLSICKLYPVHRWVVFTLNSVYQFFKIS